MQIIETSIQDVVILTPARHGDDRGWFEESWNARRMADAGLHHDWVQDNHSRSRLAGTVRGLHYQRGPHEQAKLVRCLRGAIFDVAVDARRGSPTYRQWAGTVLTAENGRQLLVPRGFLHGFVTLEQDCEVMYKCDGYYNREAEGAVRWDSCGIPWPWDRAVHLKPEDAAAPPFDAFDTPFRFSPASPAREG